MSNTIEMALNASGYDFTKKEDCQWLLAQVNQFEELVTKAEDRIEELEYAEEETE